MTIIRPKKANTQRNEQYCHAFNNNVPDLFQMILINAAFDNLCLLLVEKGEDFIFVQK